MKKNLIAFAIAICFLIGSAQASTCPTTDVIQDPAAFVWTDAGGYYEGTLEIGAANFTFNNGESLTTRAYRQADGNYSIPGPTMYMTPGNTYVLTFKNNLPYSEHSMVENDLKDPDISNIHTHGLHVSGETPADDVTRHINGGYCGDYVYPLEDTHMGGTLWYHAHHHGSTWLQVAGGTFGMLIINDSADGIPPGVADMEERLLAIGFLEPGRVAGNGGDTLISGTLQSTWTVNGEVAGNLCTPIGEWQHWRVLIADPDARMKTVTVGSACEAVLLARDGVWRTVAPKALPGNTIELTGASRADLAVRCSADSTIKVDNTVVANIFADAALPTNSSVGPYSGGATGTNWSAIRPNYLRDLREESPAFTGKISMGARSVNGEKFDAYIPAFFIDKAGIQEWSIQGATNHPFHLHVYHQQVQQDCGGAFESGEYYDTIAGSCTVRLEVNPATQTAYDGRTIMHCHILEHEDQGAMIWANTTLGGFGPPTLPSGKQVLYQCGDVTPPPHVCSDITNKNECNSDPTCEWQGKGKNAMCVDIGTTAGGVEEAWKNITNNIKRAAKLLWTI